MTCLEWRGLRFASMDTREKDMAEGRMDWFCRCTSQEEERLGVWKLQWYHLGPESMVGCWSSVPFPPFWETVVTIVSRCGLHNSVIRCDDLQITKCPHEGAKASQREEREDVSVSGWSPSRRFSPV